MLSFPEPTDPTLTVEVDVDDEDGDDKEQTGGKLASKTNHQPRQGDYYATCSSASNDSLLKCIGGIVDITDEEP